MKKYSDKIQHLIVSAFIVMAVSHLINRFIPGYHDLAVQLGVYCAIAWGVIKEYLDSLQPDNKWDWWDIAADTAGIILAVWVL
jgi:uncharacterized protein YfiM (DUF2279 family)